MLLSHCCHQWKVDWECISDVCCCQTHELPWSCAHGAACQSSWRTSYRFYLSVDLLPCLVKSPLNTNDSDYSKVQSTVTFCSQRFLPSSMIETVKKSVHLPPMGFWHQTCSMVLKVEVSSLLSICHTVIFSPYNLKKCIWYFSSHRFACIMHSHLFMGDSSIISSVWISLSSESGGIIVYV